MYELNIYKFIFLYKTFILHLPCNNLNLNIMCYPAGLENDSKAPYNESIDVFECLECRKQIDIGYYCESCTDYLQREKQKIAVIDKCQQLKNLFETASPNIYAVNKLGEIINEINKI